ncbi:MAG: hypothetical protein WBC22_16570 [Sedimentisphaerales bacterium]
MAGVAQILPNRRNTTKPNCPHSQKVLVVPSITLFLCAFCAFLWLKNPFNQRNQRLINDLRSTKVYVRNYNLFMQNKANFRKVKLNVNKVLTKDYEKMDTWWSGKNKPNSNPIQTQYKPNQTQLKPIKCQNKPNSNPNKPNSPRPQTLPIWPGGGKLRINLGKYYAKSNFVPLCRITNSQRGHPRPLKDL